MLFLWSATLDSHKGKILIMIYICGSNPSTMISKVRVMYNRQSEFHPAKSGSRVALIKLTALTSDDKAHRVEEVPITTSNITTTMKVKTKLLCETNKQSTQYKSASLKISMKKTFVHLKKVNNRQSMNQIQTLFEKET